MGLLDRFRKRRRSFDAAKGTRYTGDWLAKQGTGDDHLKKDLVSLRERARDLERNDGYAESLFIELESNIIGDKGIQFKPAALKADLRGKGGLTNKPDTDACEKIAQAWADYSKKGNFEVSRMFSRAQFERLAIRTIARDGGILIRDVSGFPNNDYKFAVQGLEVDCLNPRYSDAKKRIHMSIEYDEWDAPVAYHIEDKNTKSNLLSRPETIPIPADEMQHLFLSRRLTQSQGFSWLAPVMLRLRHLSKYEESEVIAARSQSNNQGFFKRNGEQQYRGEEDGEGNIVAPSAPNQWTELPPGVDPIITQPTHPNGNYPDFRKAILRGVCAGIYVNYNTLAKDLEGVSFSSIRQGVLSERDIWRIIQAWFIDEFETPIFEKWLKMALTKNQIEGYGIKDYERLCRAEFSGRTWSWVDPLKDINAIEKEIALGLNSRQSVARDKSKDFGKLVKENEEDLKALDDAGLLPKEPEPVVAETVAPNKKE